MRHRWGMDGFFMEHGCMGPKHSSWNFPCFNGQYVSGLWLPGHWNPCQGCLPNWHVRCFRYLLAQASNWAVAGLESCHVSVMAIFSGLVISKRQIWCQVITKTWLVLVLVCSRARATNTSKLAPNYLKTNDAFTTCCWNNIEGFYLVYFSIWTTFFFW